ncbi:anacyclamide/piricyclamide family prenylated cyclic peptide [Planktothrix agardhii 1801]|jgi:prenylated cyclic peptide (anacyclamide/piricyclamide family)|nr:anacyclamide/piricyclamide family prenylated cyclic peptide [Planktothrix agardhii]MCF3626134.1 anacyclamide/piricyclamide family prenylated cyclic peptide [Planktothrix agardhii 1801]
MTKKNLKPKQAAPVQRENTATVARDGNAIAPSGDPFAGDDAE